jgi:hypothetical protein
MLITIDVLGCMGQIQKKSFVMNEKKWNIERDALLMYPRTEEKVFRFKYLEVSTWLICFFASIKDVFNLN